MKCKTCMKRESEVEWYSRKYGYVCLCVDCFLKQLLFYHSRDGDN